MKRLSSNKITNIAIITARAGSRRIKNKNIKLFFNKPIIYYSIRILQKANIFDKILVTTNCPKTIKIVRNLGIKDIIIRKNYFNQDHVGTISVINFCIKELKKNKIKPKYICCHYPAAPLTNFKDIVLAYKILLKKRINFIFPVINLLREKYNNKIIKISSIKKKEGILNDKYLDAGQFWYGKTNTWIKSKTVYDKNSFLITTDLEYSDINTMKDWNNVKKIFSKSSIF